MFTWKAIYKDGTTHQYNSENFDMSNVDMDQVDKFQIIDIEGTIPLLQIHLDDPRKRLIYVRRTEKASNLPYPLISHIVGWQMNVGGENIQSIQIVFETIIVGWNGEPEKSEKTRKHICWIESIGKYDRNRDSRFYSPTEKQLKIIGSNSL